MSLTGSVAFLKSIRRGEDPVARAATIRAEEQSRIDTACAEVASQLIGKQDAAKEILSSALVSLSAPREEELEKATLLSDHVEKLKQVQDLLTEKLTRKVADLLEIRGDVRKITSDLSDLQKELAQKQSKPSAGEDFVVKFGEKVCCHVGGVHEPAPPPRSAHTYGR